MSHISRDDELPRLTQALYAWFRRSGGYVVARDGELSDVVIDGTYDLEQLAECAAAIVTYFLGTAEGVELPKPSLLDAEGGR